MINVLGRGRSEIPGSMPSACQRWKIDRQPNRLLFLTLPLSHADSTPLDRCNLDFHLISIYCYVVSLY